LALMYAPRRLPGYGFDVDRRRLPQRGGRPGRRPVKPAYPRHPLTQQRARRLGLTKLERAAAVRKESRS
jgi:hypothetical protein